MRTFAANRYGGADVMSFCELPVQHPGKGEVLVKLRASSVNPVDFKVRQGMLRIVMGWRFPKVFGCDLAGEVQELGAGVTDLRVGDAVYGYVAMMFGKRGAHAEFCVTQRKHLRRLPEGMDFEEAASLPVAALTALNGFRQCGPLEGKAVLVNGASGGVGHFAVQIAVARGAKVTAVCSARNAELPASLGAAEVLDYKLWDVTTERKRFDVFFDAFALLGVRRAAPAIQPGGYYVSTLPGPGLMLNALRERLLGGARVVMANMRDKQEDYAALEALIAEGKLRPVIGKRFPFEHIAEAYGALETGGTQGKIVVVF